MGVKTLLFDGEPITKALRRFRRELDRHGVTKEMRVHKYYEKPSVRRRRKKCHDWFFVRTQTMRAKQQTDSRARR